MNDAKLQWLQDPSEAIDCNLGDERREVGRYFRNKEMEYLKDILVSFNQAVRTRTLETCIGINECKTVTNPEVTGKGGDGATYL
jgi:hypothetical protein